MHKEHGVVDVFGKYRPYDILTSVVALNRLQNAAILYERMNRDQHQFPELVPEVNEKDRALVRDLVHYAVYAHAAYGWTMNLAMRRQLHMGGNVRALLRMTGVDRDDIIRAQWESKTHRPAYFVVRDRMHKSIVLCIRGTWSAHDLLTNLCCTPQDFESALAVAKKLSSSLYYSAEDLYIRATNRRRCGHHGMLEAARSVQKDSEAAISKALKENSNYSLILVGHSLGGGVAALLGTLFERNYPDLRVYIYGAPCVAPTYAKLHRNIVSVVMEGDPFRCISLGHIADVSIALSCLCEDPALRSEIIVRTSSPVRSMDDDDLEWCFDTMETLRTNMTAEKLFPPGRILLLSGDTTPLLPPWGWLWRRRRSTNRRGVSLREVPPRYFRDLVVGPQMVDLSKHVPSIYELTLRSLIDDST